MTAWEPHEASFWRCRFSYPNPEPEPEPSEEYGPDWGDDHDWEPFIECGMPARTLVQLEDGRYLQTCSPRAHGVAPVAWWAPWSGPIPEFDWERALKYFYAPARILALAEMEYPLFQLVRSAR